MMIEAILKLKKKKKKRKKKKMYSTTKKNKTISLDLILNNSSHASYEFVTNFLKFETCESHLYT